MCISMLFVNILAFEFPEGLSQDQCSLYIIDSYPLYAEFFTLLFI